MPSGSSWKNYIYVNLGFAFYIFIIFYYIQLNQIKQNWPLYRCNPMYMFFADNIEQNFQYCIQTTQTNFMGYLLQPLEFITSSLSGMIGNFSTEINSVRAMIDKIRNLISSITQNIFGVFINVVIQFQKITIGVKDTFQKIVGILITVIYIISGSVMTMNSAWSGPPGQMIRRLGKCFHPETEIKLKNGNIVKIKDINLGDILENDSVVYATMKIDNKVDKEDLYEILNDNTDTDKNNNKGNSILVTGNHLVYNKNNELIKVKNYEKATKTNIQTDTLVCLITSDHKIQIGSEIFWDWEDHYIK
jgi:hypothetical protein